MYSLQFWFRIELLLASCVAAGSLALLVLLSMLGWHLYYKAVGRSGEQKNEYYPYHERLATRGFYTLGAMFGILAAFGVVTMVGRNITARMASAQTVTKVDSTFAVGTYVRVTRDQLPKDSRKMLGKNDVLFVRATANQNGDRFVIKAYENEDELEGRFPVGSKFELVEIRWRYRYPAQVFRFWGPVTDRMDIVKTLDGREMAIKGLTWWSSLKS